MEVLFRLVMILAWGLIAVLNFWIWQKGRGKGNMLMLVGAAILVLDTFILWVSKFPDTFAAIWLPLIGLVLFTAGFYLSVQGQVAEHVAKIKSKIAPPPGKSGGEGGGSAS